MSSRQIAAAVVIYLIKKRKEKKEKNKRKIWVRKWIQRRATLGLHEKLLNELRMEGPQQLKNFLRMSAKDFDFLLGLVKEKIYKKDTKMRQAIRPEERLSLTLRFLATGDSYHSLMYLYRIPVCTIARIVPECCAAIVEALKKEYLKVPNTQEEWIRIAKDFKNIWNFPNCLGALDGKHVVMQAPPCSGSYYFNYKGTHSIVLMALADANYKFIYVDVGCNGRISDGGVYNMCSLSTALENNTVNLPPPQQLPGMKNFSPFVFVADDAFAMKPNLLKPYPFKNQPGPNRVFNYRLSGARRIIENTF
ncbi:uncharacterized protein LOC126735220 [Anthonomus grandis grandis]|uniref:uncharacterized protein LOC126735220 n=1 Tax=Anthonomus grandis grandis TaxID=2921223 RepID=UPI002165B273|nr:uncharacterized protein LOC126735220 [Anthonomus grandis grandis]